MTEGTDGNRVNIPSKGKPEQKHQTIRHQPQTLRVRAESANATEKTVDEGATVTVIDSLEGAIEVVVTKPPISHTENDG